ncbi:sensor domain-containing diguanylate cyclase [Brevibacillus migulae]|uniref:sensor domain-containing diguanylate cyclase n=1 Tax=Brevibacillus migulae TaxID=1644114 RepID=UPI00106EF783|nr:sensor domain-containing diguanylate cyclase [Brevibacillus migulae]
MIPKSGVTLRFVLIALVILSILSMLVVSAFSALQANKQSLIQSYLESNKQYAQKLSFTTGNILQIMQNHLEDVSLQAEHHSYEEVQRLIDNSWTSRNVYFNSMVVVDRDLIIRAISPEFTGAHVGDQLTSEAARTAVMQKRPLVSAPFKAKTGRMIILVSMPIMDRTGEYKGFVGGTIYLQEDNVLSKTLSKHFYDNGSYLYVVDKTGQIIYHPQSERIGDDVRMNEVVQKVLAGQSGAQQVINSQGESFLAGYAHEEYSGWGIVSQTPSSIIFEPSKDLVFEMIKLGLPFFIIIMIVAAFVALKISKPLYLLAKMVEEATVHKGQINTELPEIHSGIYEVKQLFQSAKLALETIDHRMHQLHMDIQTDALTGLANRRTFDQKMKEHLESHTPFSLIFLDIDSFKKVNDTFGHLTGDEVLKYLGGMMSELTRPGDLCFRYGGEEFAIIVPYGDRDIARDVAERLRSKVELTQSPTGQPITISLGIAIYPEHGADAAEIIQHADQAMYQSKAQGRNQTTIFSKE